MRIRSMRVDGFGKFSGFECGPLERPVTIFLGANEAGKSTLLAFIRRVLFGFPDGRSRKNPYPPLAGGRHGGSVTIVSDAGEAFTVHRFQGAGGGPVMLSTLSGEPRPTGELAALLGHHSRDVFHHVFAFTLDELRDDALLKDETINSQIYSAGMGAFKLPAALKALAEDKGRLFLKGGSKHALHEAATALDRVDSGLREVRNNADEYGELSARLKDIKEELEHLNRRRREHQLRIDQQQRLESAWSDWNELDTVKQKLAGLPATENFPSDGVSRLEALEERVRTTRREHDSAKGDAAEANAKIGTQIEHEAILCHADEIRGLEQGHTAFKNAVSDLPKRENELEEQRNALAATLKDLGTDWDESRLKNFDLSLAVRNEISQQKQKLRKTSEEFSRGEANLDRDGRAFQESSEAENRAKQALQAAARPSLDEEQRKQRRTRLRSASLRLGQRDFARKRAADLQDQFDTLKGAAASVSKRHKGKTIAAVALAVGGMALAALGAVLGVSTLPVGIAAGSALGSVALVGIAAYLFASARPARGADADSPLVAPIRNSLRKAKVELQKLESALKQDATSLGVEMIDEVSLNAASEELNREQSRALERQGLSADLERVRELTRQRKNTRDKARDALEQAGKQRETAQGSWREWLRTRGLRETFAPETVVELRGKVELGLAQLRELENRRRRVEAIRNDINNCAARVEPLALNFGIYFDKKHAGTITAAAEQLVDLYGETERKVRDRKETETEAEKATRRLKGREGDFRQARAETKKLLQSGGAANTEEFRKRAELHRQHADLIEKQRDLMMRLQRLSGPGEDLKSLVKKLGDTNIEAISGKLLRAGEERDAVVNNIKDLSTELGSIQSDLNRLTGEAESSKLRVERHRLLEEMRGHAREWAVHTIAENLLKDARSKFEKERQPDVLRHSKGYFQDITGGRYQAVFSPLGSSEIHVRDHDGSTKQPVQLSRGAREQLFLALRFGLVRELGQRSEKLPVIVDEALVNFDPDRGIRAAQAFFELTEQNQVLVFTCHPQIVDWFAKAAAKRGAQPPQTIPLD